LTSPDKTGKVRFQLSRANVAQSVEQLTRNEQVVRSIRIVGSMIPNDTDDRSDSSSCVRSSDRERIKGHARHEKVRVVVRGEEESGMQLDDAQKNAVREWVERGAGLSEVQKRLRGEYGITMTYIDVRFLMIDLGLEVQNRPDLVRATVQPPPLTKDPSQEELTDEVSAGHVAPPGAGNIRVHMDRIMKPGSLASGKVTFSDGVSASWMIDQMGRLALAPEQKGYKPAQTDLMAFQAELRSTLESHGY
jgi:hypothetical protein